MNSNNISTKIDDSKCQIEGHSNNDTNEDKFSKVYEVLKIEFRKKYAGKQMPCVCKCSDDAYFLLFNTEEDDRKYLDMDKISDDLQALGESKGNDNDMVSPKLVVNKRLNWYASYLTIGTNPMGYFMADVIKSNNK